MPSFTFTSPYSIFALRGEDARCGFCGRDTSAPGGMVFRSESDPEGADLLGPELSRYMAETEEVWSGGSAVAREGIESLSLVRVEGRGYALCENCEVVLLERDGLDEETRGELG